MSGLGQAMHPTWCMAERVGVEPTIPLLAGYTISNRAPSASRASLRDFTSGEILLTKLTKNLLGKFSGGEGGMCSSASLLPPPLRVAEPNPALVGEGSHPIEYFYSCPATTPTWFVAERVGFEPTSPFGRTAFRERRLKPLGNLSDCQ